MRSRWAIALAAGLVACSSSREPARAPPRESSAAPAFRQAAELLPADLDIVARIDLARLRRGIMGHRLASLEPRFDGEPTSLLRVVLGKGSLLHVGLRSVPRGLDADAVIAAQGDFTDLSLGGSMQGGLQRVATDLPGVARFERKEARRGESSLVFLLRGSVVAIATPIEAPSLERTVLQGPDAERLEPPAEGVVGVAIRPRAAAGYLAQRYEHLARLVNEAGSLNATLSLEGEALHGELNVTFKKPSSAERAALVLQAYVDEISRDEGSSSQLLGRSLTVVKNGDRALSLRLKLALADLDRLTG